MKSVVICGSSRFKAEVREFAKKLKELNVTVYEPYFHNPENEWNKLPERKVNKKYLVVVYREINKKEGFVITAFYTSDLKSLLKKRKIIWKKQQNK